MVMEYYKDVVSDTDTMNNISKEKNISISSANLVRNKASKDFEDKSKNTIFETPKGDYAFLENSKGFYIAHIKSIEIPSMDENLLEEIDSFRLLKSKMAEQEILSMLQEHADFSAAQIFDRLLEKYPTEFNVCESTITRIFTS